MVHIEVNVLHSISFADYTDIHSLLLRIVGLLKLASSCLWDTESEKEPIILSPCLVADKVFTYLHIFLYLFFINIKIDTHELIINAFSSEYRGAHL